MDSSSHVHYNTLERLRNLHAHLDLHAKNSQELTWYVHVVQNIQISWALPKEQMQICNYLCLKHQRHLHIESEQMNKHRNLTRYTIFVGAFSFKENQIFHDIVAVHSRGGDSSYIFWTPEIKEFKVHKQKTLIWLLAVEESQLVLAVNVTLQKWIMPVFSIRMLIHCTWYCSCCHTRSPHKF